MASSSARERRWNLFGSSIDRGLRYDLTERVVIRTSTQLLMTRIDNGVDMCLAVPGKIIEIHTTAALRMARVDFGGVVREVCIETLPEAVIGDYTIVHAGFALNLLSEEEAQATLDLLRELAEFQDTIDLESQF